MCVLIDFVKNPMCAYTPSPRIDFSTKFLYVAFKWVFLEILNHI